MIPPLDRIDTMIGRPKQLRRPRLTIRRILAWADSEHRFRGRWPRKTDGPVLRHPDETWEGIDSALRSGHRGLPGGSSLPKLLFERRGVRNSRGLSPLTEEQIVTWARVHLAVTGTWPSNGSGTVLAAPGRTGKISIAPCVAPGGGCRGATPWRGCWPGGSGCGT